VIPENIKVHRGRLPARHHRRISTVPEREQIAELSMSERSFCMSSKQARKTPYSTKGPFCLCPFPITLPISRGSTDPIAICIAIHRLRREGSNRCSPGGSPTPVGCVRRVIGWGGVRLGALAHLPKRIAMIATITATGISQLLLCHS